MKKTTFVLIILLSIYLLAIVTREPQNNRDNGMLTGIEIWNKILVPTLHKKFLSEIKTTKQFEDFLNTEGGNIVLDHGGTRTLDPKVHQFIKRMANAFNLELYETYVCPHKKLIVENYQFHDGESFKWFSTLIDTTQLSLDTQKVIAEDLKDNRTTLSQQGMLLLTKLERKKALDIKEARALVDEILFKYLKRNSKPLELQAYKRIEKESPIAAKTLLSGPEFYHIAFDLNQLGIEEWYGIEIIEALSARLEGEGFQMNPSIAGKEGGNMRQTGTMPEIMEYEVLNNGTTVTVKEGIRFIEFVQRGAERDNKGKVIVDQKKVKKFKGVLREEENPQQDPKKQNLS